MKVPALAPKIIGALLCVFVLIEVNYPIVRPQTQLAVFALLGLVLVFLRTPTHARLKDHPADFWIGMALALVTVLVFGFIVVQSEPVFQSLWYGGMSLGDRAGAERPMDHWVALAGLLLVFEATRRAIGWTLPLLSLTFILYAAYGSSLPDWLFPHRGYSWERIASQTFLHSQGVFGVALKVMFTYVFLFVIFGALLERTGATAFIIDFARKLFRNSAGGPAKVSVISSGMMGSLSGSAVANTATTGTFTIPMMRSGGFSRNVAAAIEAAASSGGALVPPVMGAGAYMMLEIVDPPVTFLQIIRAALIPAILYYFALLQIVHFYAKRVAREKGVDTSDEDAKNIQLSPMRGLIFFGSFFALIVFLLTGFTPFRSVSLTLPVILVLALFSVGDRLGPRRLFESFHKAAFAGVSLIAAAACVGVIVGVVTLTGVGAKLPGVLLPLAESNLGLALALLMVSTLILGMGLPSAVCYLLMATLIGPVLGDLGVPPLGAHLFIFYFGMMSMVTPPVALAAYTAGTIAGSEIMKTGFTAFRFALVGFALPYSFVLRPGLLMLTQDGQPASILSIIGATLITAAGAMPLAASVAGHWLGPLKLPARIALGAAAGVLLVAPLGGVYWILHGVAVMTVAVTVFMNRER